MVSVVQDWIFNLPMQQQSVLFLAARGPDGFSKEHPTKALVRTYRSCIWKNARYGREMSIRDPNDTFMYVSTPSEWDSVKNFIEFMEELPVHFVTHFLHGTEILGYKHPYLNTRRKWNHFYTSACIAMHVNPETEDQLNARLNDWDHKYWEL